MNEPPQEPNLIASKNTRVRPFCVSGIGMTMSMIKMPQIIPINAPAIAPKNQIFPVIHLLNLTRVTYAEKVGVDITFFCLFTMLSKA